MVPYVCSTIVIMSVGVTKLDYGGKTTWMLMDKDNCKKKCCMEMEVIKKWLCKRNTNHWKIA